MAQLETSSWTPLHGEVLARLRQMIIRCELKLATAFGKTILGRPLVFQEHRFAIRSELSIARTR